MFISRYGDCAVRQTRPGPGGDGSTMWTVSRVPGGSSSGAEAHRRSRTLVPRGPAPTTARDTSTAGVVPEGAALTADKGVTPGHGGRMTANRLLGAPREGSLEADGPPHHAVGANPNRAPGGRIAARCGMRHGYLTRPSRTSRTAITLASQACCERQRMTVRRQRTTVHDRGRSRSDLGLHDRPQSGGAPALPRAGLLQSEPGRTSVQGQGHELVAEPRAARFAPVDGRPVARAVPGEPTPDRPADRAPPEAEAEPYGEGDGVVDGGAGQLEDAGVGGAGESGAPGVPEGHRGSAM